VMSDQSASGGRRFGYYDRQADIVWFPTGWSDDVVNEEKDWGIVDHDAVSDEVVGIEIWKASERLPTDLLAALPDPPAGSGDASASACD
jgi:uncharacterized protein YuzE